MNAYNESKERRQYTRFLTKGGTVIALNANFGELIDISFGGLSFRYLGKDEWPNDMAEGEGMFFGDDDSFWSNVPLKTVSDDALDNEEYAASKQVRRHSMAFGELTPQQMHQLMDFIQTNTV